ncbi:beta strand repeat-containing protein [Nostoc sp. UHCC 0870]|uniref:beta strand repeat-containing protein n=1 Tax=Nostoc sp. UHCC 0870 TaxID=2914041 RepID=UPI001EDDF3F1|nr:right-handed parallel beta-helix repeat-containing protein [Nostoc sp. UHCC 0870]UKO97843.1 right-handed parallel beta-helix repeat-containing protein [Nostoc sp. UHCC 0870]
MNNLQYLGCFAVLGVLASASTAMAQTSTAPTFTPRLGVRYTTEGSGYESFSSFEGFLPVFQTPGNSLTFLQGKVLLDNDSNVATNILLGHRIFSPEGNRVVGGYIAYSTRDTGKSNFNQLGLGFETLGNWDFRFNAYLPLGTSENQVSVINTGSGFQGNSFLLGRQRSFEVAMSGVDAEFGTRLVPLGAGDLRGFVGAYYYSGGESKEAFGWRTRVEARPTDFLNFGLSLQHDDLFDTRLVFTIGANFPGSGGRGTKPKKDSALLRMAESSDRQSAILVTNERRNDTVVATGTNNQPLTIIYVANNGTGNGTFESPLGSVTNAVGIAKANNIIYVLADTPTTIAPFTIPDGVQVLSSALAQTVNTQQFGLVTLPLSGNGIYPVITGSVTAENGLVTLGNNTVLSGFDIQVQGSDDARGIKGTNISNVRILDNKITNALSEGIYLENVTGIVEIARNTITDTRNPATDTSLESGIFVWNYQDNTNLSITDNRIATNFNAADYRIDGIEVNLCRDVDQLFVSKTCASNASITATITNNQIIHNGQISGGADGIDINLGNLGKGTFTISNNTLTNIPDEGISINAVANSEGDFTIANNIITNVGDSSIEVDLFLPDPNISPAVNLFNNSRTQFVITGNTLDGTDNDGIDFAVADNADTTITIANNTIQNIGDGDSGDRGIQLAATNNAIIRPTITNNTITNVTGDGISLSQVTDATVTNNNLNNINSDGIEIDNASGNNNISSNTISNVSNDGIDINVITNANITNNNISNAGDDGIYIYDASGDNNISSNTISNVSNDGIDLDDVNNANVTNNNISNAGDDGIYIDDASGDNNISSNTISNVSNDGIDLDDVNNANVTNNNISNAGDDGIDIDDASGNNNISSNTISDVSGDGIEIDDGTNSNVTNNNISNTGDDGIDIDDASGNNNISSNTISDVSGDGIEIDDVTNASVTNNNISNAGDDGIDIDDVSGNNNISSNIISDVSGDGIEIDDGTNANVTNNNITRAGDNGIDIADTQGTINVDSNTITDAQQESISLSEVTGTVSVSQNIVNGNNSNNGIAIANTTGTTNLTINSNQLTENFNDIRVSLSDTTGTLQINDNTITNNGTAIDVQLGENTNLTSVSLNNNQITGVDASITSSGINLQAFDNAAADNVTASGNTINTITNGDGMNFQLNGTSTATFQIATNIISNIRDTDAGDFNFTDGINFEIFDAASSTVELSNNVIDQIQGYGISVTNFSSGIVNVTIMNNQITNTQDGEVFTAP